MYAAPTRHVSGKNGLTSFADPFLTESTQFLPETLGDSVWDLCQYMFGLNRRFVRGLERVIDYHLTDVDFSGDARGDTKEVKELREYLLDHLKIFDLFKSIGLEWATYGNSFPVPNLPFDRVLVDRRDGHYREWTIAMCEKLGPVRYQYSNNMYQVVDPLQADRAVSKRKTITLPFRDRVSKDWERLSFDTLNIRDVILNVAPMGGATRVVRRFHPSFSAPLETGDPFFASTVPIDFLTASQKKQDYVYHPDYVRHFKAPQIKGLRNQTFAIPETLMCFRENYHLQVLRRADEVTGQDSVLPFRLVSPNVTGNGAQFVDANMSVWRSEMEYMIKNKRENPYAIHAVPFPVTGQQLFNDGHGFVPAEIMQWHNDNLFDALNVPVDLYKGKLEQELVPVALRLFASGWTFMYRGFNDILRWIVEWIYNLRREDPPKARLLASRQADDMERRQFLVQLTAAGEISRKTGYAGFDIEDAVKEKSERMDEDIDIQRIQEKKQQQYQQEQTLGSMAQQAAQQGGGAAPSGAGGQAAGPQGGVSMNPQQRQDEAVQKAQEWAGMDDGARRKDMDQVRNTDETLYALAKDQYAKLKRSGESQGRQQVMQQAKQQVGQQGAQPPPQ